jgi:hypothetical protein
MVKSPGGFSRLSLQEETAPRIPTVRLLTSVAVGARIFDA